MFLTPEQLLDLTGYRRHAEQVKWLRKNGVKVFVRRDGAPRVLLCDLERRPERRTVREPDFGAMEA